MNLMVQRLIRQGLTALAGVLATKGFLAAEAAESWTVAGAEFLGALVLGVISFLWSSVNAWWLKKSNPDS